MTVVAPLDKFALAPPRLDRPIRITPSGAERLSLCPGSYWAAEGLKSDFSDAAAEGNLMHDVMAGREANTILSASQRADIAFCQEQAHALVEQVLGAARYRYFRERFLTVQTPAYRLNGKGDWVGFAIEKIDGFRPGLVIDYKFGRGHVEPAESNWQGMCYAWGLANEFDCTHVTMAFIQPRVESENRLSVTEYGPDEIAAVGQILDRLAQSIRAAETRNPGPTQCKYCPALASDRCPETQNAIVDVSRSQPWPVPMPSGARLARWLESAEIASAAIAILKDHAKAVLAAGTDPEFAALYELKPGAKRREIEDPLAAFQALSETLTAVEFTECCSVRVGDLTDLWGRKTGTPVKERTKALGAVLGELVTIKENAPSLRRIE